MPTNHEEHDRPQYPAASGDVGAYPEPGAQSTQLGYETTDANVIGVAAFLGGLFGFVVIFFFFCYIMGGVINTGILKQDGPANRWHAHKQIFAGRKPQKPSFTTLESNPSMSQQQFQSVTAEFPSPRLVTDDGNQETADLHAREDLLLNHYSSAPGQALRIPIDRAMQLIAQRGLPVAPPDPAAQADHLAYDTTPTVTTPLTDGFARTGPELDDMQARQQRLEYGKAVAGEHAELNPTH